MQINYTHISRFDPAILPANYQTVSSPGRNQNKKGVEWANIVSTFDIETTSYTLPDGTKIAFMYHWQFYMNGYVLTGRTEDELLTLFRAIKAHFGKVRLPVYVHYLGFEFSFLCTRFNWKRVFCTGSRNPIRALMADYPIEFRDSLILSGLSLEKLPTTTKKLKGDLDYSLIRHHQTPMTRQEIQYCINDVVVLAEYITDKLGNDDMATIPMTRTGYVRRDVRTRLIKAKQMPRQLTMTPEQYKRLRQIYAGGFTHASAHSSGMVMSHVRSLDITSSYPTVLCAEFYPVSKFTPYTPTDTADLHRCLSTYACMLHVKFYGIREKPGAYEHIISKSKCIDFRTSQDHQIDNGRIVRAEFIEMELTEIDLMDITRFYDYDKILVSDMEIAYKGRLPRALVEAILDYYAQKTTLKGLKGPLPDGSDAETMYALYKEFVNGIYGCFVTDPVKPDITYNGNWITTENDIEEEIARHNSSRNRWCFYAWGVWCTAYARHNLFSLMEKMGPDYLYADTDSLKILNYPAHKAEFDAYNAVIQNKLLQACRDLGIDPAKAAPKNQKGVPCPLGVWTDEGEYDEFKTLGAKRYLTLTGGEYHPTVAGAPKKAFTDFISTFPDPFSAFADELVVPADMSGKNLHSFQKEDRALDITDYTGRTVTVNTYKDSTHVSPTTVSINLSDEYSAYLLAMGLNPDEVTLDKSFGKC